jgi:thymidylate synthase
MEERQYLDLITRILETGSFETGRNGSTKSVFGNMMRFSLRDGTLPLLTTKQVAWKTCFNELMWFIRGDTDNQLLREKGVRIWDLNCSREYLDSIGLNHYEAGRELGPIYGWQWRNFNKEYYTMEEKEERRYQYEAGEMTWEEYNVLDGVDQLQQIIDELKDPERRSSRRLIMTAWNPLQLRQMALPPCHILCQFNVRNGKYLSCALYQRSGDVGLGVPFNIASYSFLTHIIAKHCGLEAEEFVYFLGNAHIYEQHLEPLSKQLNNVPYTFPKIEIKEQRERIEDYCIDDIVWKTPYKHHPSIKMDMIA